MVGAAPTCLTPPRAQEQPGTVAWEDTTHQLSSGDCTSALSPWLANSKRDSGAHADKAKALSAGHTRLSQLSCAPNPLSVLKTALQQHTQKIPWAEAFLPCSQTRDPTGMKQMGENFLCSSCFSPALAEISEPWKKHSLVKVMI